MAGSSPEKIAIIGAGMAGLTCATSLTLSVPDVHVFEQALHPGGRMGVIRERGFEFDAGTQYFTAQDERFAMAVDGWLDEGVVQPWSAWVVELERGNFLARPPEARYVAVPHMGGLSQHLAELCTRVEYGTPVERLEKQASGWRLYDRFGTDLGCFDLVVTAVPPAEAMRLLGEAAPDLGLMLTGQAMSACWTLLVGSDDGLPLMFDAAFIGNSPLRWAARNNSKPGRAPREAWVLQATPEWSEAHLDDTPDDVAGALWHAFEEAAGGLPGVRPQVRRAELWREAQPIAGLEQPFLFDAQNGVAACGDWCLGPRVEAAFLSGLALADRILQDV
ncbi:MAG: FAD-dependent oxidoreductase [Gammaproteobacteria bacterium]|jgi:renalase